jgi:hypothetical protein
MRQDVYRVAYDEAIAELIEIKSRVEQLILRRARVEGVVKVLGPLLEGAAPATTPIQVQAAPVAQPNMPEQSADPNSYSFNQVPVPLPDLDETGGDPFKRRVRNALKQQGLQTAV